MSGGRTEEKRRNSEPALELKRKKWLFFLGYSKYFITFAHYNSKFYDKSKNKYI